MSKPVLVIGDIMLDTYIEGNCDRISPEAPVPVILASNESYILGGAANVANNLHHLNIPVVLFGAIAQDINGQHIKQLLTDKKIEHKLIEDHHTTTTKSRIIARGQQLLRIDHEKPYSPSKFFLKTLEETLNKVNPEWIIISDYNKGSISSDTMEVIKSFALQRKAQFLVDPKGNDWEKYTGAYLIKPNLKEISDYTQRKIENTDSAIESISFKPFHSITEHLLITRSQKGMSLMNSDSISHHPIDPIDVFDVTGAGDTAIASIIYALYNGSTLIDAVKIANESSRYVVTKNRTYPISIKELKQLLAKNKNDRVD